MASRAARLPAFPARTLARVAALALVVAAAAPPVLAAKVYRCGNAFQDQPCAEVKLATAAPAERPVTIARDTVCAKRDASERNDCSPKPALPREQLTDIRR